MPITISLRPGPFLRHVHCIGVAVAASWTGDTIAELLKRLIARMGRPAAYLQDGGSDLHKAAALLDEQGLGSLCIDDIAHAAAGMLKRTYQHHPAFESFLSACGRVSGKLKQTLLACLAPPSVRTKARFMHVHRLFTWADRVLKLAPRWCQGRFDLGGCACLGGFPAYRPHRAFEPVPEGLLGARF
jgi:hypothetical protein